MACVVQPSGGHPTEGFHAKKNSKVKAVSWVLHWTLQLCYYFNLAFSILSHIFDVVCGVRVNTT